MSYGTNAELLHIEGRVQGVGYRAATLRQAAVLGLTGRVRNLPDGRVEAHMEGSAEALDRLAQWCARGPALARVEHVLRTPVPLKGFTDLGIDR